ncbi:GNAT family N-acetyltransferase [Bacteroidota bacterium]
MEIVKAHMSHLIEALYLIRQCNDELLKKNIVQWDEENATMQAVKDDIENGFLYVMREKNVTIGTMALSPSSPVKEQNENDPKKTATVYRLAIFPFWQKKGIGQKLMSFAEKYAIENGFENIRVNISIKNSRAMNFYTTRKYIKTYEFVSDKTNEEYMCFEKELVGELVN